MPIRFTCSCGQPVTASDYDAGAQITCPHCSQSVIVPTARSHPSQIARPIQRPPTSPAPLSKPPAPSPGSPDPVAGPSSDTAPPSAQAVAVPANGPGLLSYKSPATGDAIVTPLAMDMILQTTPWVRIISVIFFIVSGLTAVVALLILLMGIILGGRGGFGLPMALALIYIPVSLIYFIPGLYLWRFANHAKAFATFRHERRLEQAMQAQKSFWKYAAIVTLVGICLYLLAIPILLLTPSFR